MSESSFLDKLNMAEQGDTSAMYEVAMEYYYGDEIEEDEQLAYEWCLKAAQLNHPLAVAQIADWFHEGECVEEDLHESYKWTMKAIDLLQGVENFYDRTENLGAMYWRLSYLYREGYVVEKNLEKSYMYRVKTAENWIFISYELANEFYENKDYSNACYWYQNSVNLFFDRHYAKYGNDVSPFSNKIEPEYKFGKNEVDICFERIKLLESLYIDGAKIEQSSTDKKKIIQGLLNVLVNYSRTKNDNNVLRSSGGQWNTNKKSRTVFKESVFRRKNFDVIFPITYGRTRFESMNDVLKKMKSNYDALGLYSQCALVGAGVEKCGDEAIDGLFESACAGCSDAILFIGRLYEKGASFIRKDGYQAVNLYKYSYSLQNIDALHSLGFALFNIYGEKEIGISMMKKSAELGSRGAKFHLDLIKDEIKDVSDLDFYDIPDIDFKFDLELAKQSIQLYDVNLYDEDELKEALLDTMNGMKPNTYSVIMNEFRKQHLRGRDLINFTDVDFRGAFTELVEDGLVEAGGVSDYGLTEDTIYISRNSTQKIKTTILKGDDWDF